MEEITTSITPSEIATTSNNNNNNNTGFATPAATIANTKIIDIGTLNCRIGNAGDVVPKVLIKSKLKTDTLSKGKIESWDNVTEILSKHVFSSSKSNSSSSSSVTSNCVVVESVWDSSMKSRERYSELLFEKFDCDGVFFSLAPTLSCYANARQVYVCCCFIRK